MGDPTLDAVDRLDDWGKRVIAHAYSLEAERDHWKALAERSDSLAERSSNYVVDLEAERDALKARVADLEAELAKSEQQRASGLGMFKMQRADLRATREKVAELEARTDLDRFRALVGPVPSCEPMGPGTAVAVPVLGRVVAEFDAAGAFRRFTSVE